MPCGASREMMRTAAKYLMQPGASVAEIVLTDEQRAVLAHDRERPGRVLAGPGTGKSATLVALIGEMVKEKRSASVTTLTAPELKTCPDCAEQIRYAARKCRSPRTGQPTRFPGGAARRLQPVCARAFPQVTVCVPAALRTYNRQRTRDDVAPARARPFHVCSGDDADRHHLPSLRCRSSGASRVRISRRRHDRGLRGWQDRAWRVRDHRQRSAVGVPRV